MGFFDFLSLSVGIDPGSAQTRISLEGELVFDEPSILSYNTENNSISGVGKEIVLSPQHLLLTPLHYVITDFQAFESYLRDSLRRSTGNQSWFPKAYKMYFSIPTNTTEVEKRAFRDSAEHAGAKYVLMIDSPYCTAMGMGILFKKKDFLIVDLSKSKCEVAFFSNSILVHEKTLRLGTHKLESLISNHINRSYAVTITEEETRMVIQNAFSNQPITFRHQSIDPVEIDKLIDHYLAFAINELTNCIESYQETNKSQILCDGIFFTGGGARYQNLCEMIAKRLNLKANLSSTPTLDNISGLSELMKNKKKYQDYWMS